MSQDAPGSPADASPRFDLLDGLRGLAAIAVMVYHYTEHNTLHWLHGAWVAVDLFFILSGFVIAHSYGRKILAGMSMRRFLLLRLIRLGPAYALGLALGIAAALVLVFHDHTRAFTGGQVATAAALGAFWLPYHNWLSWPFGGDSTFAPIFPLNEPAWSLFFELFVNGLFFLFVWRFRKLSDGRLVALAVIVFAICTIGLHHINPGYSNSNFFFGFPRVIAEFFLGALIYSTGLYRLGAPLLLATAASLMSLACFAFDSLDLALVNTFILVPLAIATISGVSVNPRMQSVCRWFGELSYPLYIVHFPMYRLVYELSDIQALNPIAQTAIMVTLTLSFALLLARVDAVLRKRLMRWARRPSAPPHPVIPAKAETQS